MTLRDNLSNDERPFEENNFENLDGNESDSSTESISIRYVRRVSFYLICMGQKRRVCFVCIKHRKNGLKQPTLTHL